MKTPLMLIAVAGTLLGASPAHALENTAPTAQASPPTNVVQGDPLAIPRYVIATGGGRSTGGAWVIRGTIGQVDAEPLQPSTDGNGFYAITGGFWPTLPAPQIDWLFADGMEAQDE